MKTINNNIENKQIENKNEVDFFYTSFEKANREYNKNMFKSFTKVKS